MKSYCNNKCCVIKSDAYKSPNHKYKKTAKKAGIFIYDPNNQMVLLVQSRGCLWGLPKGSFNNNENKYQCAIRETFEETGLIIHKNQLNKYVSVNNNLCTYFYLEMNHKPVYIQRTDGNDANGITWIRIRCLIDCIKQGKMKLNYHTKIAFQKFLNKRF